MYIKKHALTLDGYKMNVSHYYTYTLSTDTTETRLTARLLGVWVRVVDCHEHDTCLYIDDYEQFTIFIWIQAI